MIVGFNIPFSKTNKKWTKVSKNIDNLNNTVKHNVVIYRQPHTKFSSNEYDTLTKIYYSSVN